MKEDMAKLMEELSRKRVIYLIDTYCDGNRKVFSEKTNIGKSSISQYVNGTNTPGNITAKKIGDAFNVDPMWVMGFDVAMEKSADDLTLDNLDIQIMELYKELPVEKKQALIQFLKSLK